MNLKAHVPLWLFLTGLLVVASISAGVVILPRLLSPAPDFAISLNPSRITVRPQPSSSTYNDFHDENTSGSVLTVKSMHGFTGQVSLSTTNSSNIAVTLDLTKILLGTDAAMFGLDINRTMRVTASNLGNYTVTIVADSGTISHTVILTVTSQDVKIQASQASFSTAQGSTVSSTISFTSQNQFKGNLTLSKSLSILSPASPKPPYNNGEWYVNGTLNASSIDITPAATSSVTVNVRVGDLVYPGTYTFTFAAYYQQWRWNILISANVAYASEPAPTIVSYTIISSTNATLLLRNNAPVAMLLTGYRLTDAAGDLARACLVEPGGQTNYICVPTPIIDAGITETVNVLTNPQCGNCATFGNPITYQTGQSYTVTITTSRQNTFTYTIMG